MAGIVLGCCLAAPLFSQRGDGRDRHSSGPVSNPGPGPERPRPRNPGFRGAGFFYPFDYGYSAQPPAPAPAVIMLPQPPPQPVAAPQPPPHPVIHEYKEADLPAPAVERGPQPSFTIAMTDGTRRSAVAVWVQDDRLNYIGSDHRRGQVQLAAIDRDATERLNNEQNLALWLP